MPNTREKLIELLCNTPAPEVVVFGQRCGKALATAEFIADHLISNGVTVHGDKDINIPSKWISVKDRLPERKTEVLVCDTREDYVSIWVYIGDELWFGEEIIWATEDITHWMPLPQPPKGE